MSLEPPPVVPDIVPEASLLTGPFVRVLCAQMLIGLGFSSYFLLPKYLTQHLSADAANVGAVGSAALIAVVLASPPVGVALDRFGRRGPMMLGAVLIALTSIGMATVTEIGVWLYALRILQGIGYACAFNATAACVADLAPADRLGQAIGLLGVASLVTNAVAPAIAEIGASRWGWSCVFLGAAATGVATGWLAGTLPKGLRRTSVAGPTPLPASALRIWFVTAVSGAAFGTLLTFTQPFALDRGAVRLAGYFIGYTVGALVVRIAFGQAADRLGRELVARVSLGLYGVVVMLTAWLQPSLLLLFGLGFGIAHGFVYPALAALAAESSSAERRGRALSAFNGAFNGGAGLAILGCGWLAHALGYPAVFLLVGLVSVLSAALIRLQIDRPQLPSAET